MVDNLYFVLAHVVLAGYLTFLTTKGGFTDNKHSKIHKKITKRGRIAIGVIIGMVIISLGQEKNNKVIIEKKEELLKNEQNIRDSIISEKMKIAVDSINNKYYQDISIAFSKHDLRLDTVNKIMIKLKEGSLGGKVAQPHPFLFIDSSGVGFRRKIGNIYKYWLNFSVKDASATNFEIDCKMLSDYGDGTYNLTSINFLDKEIKIFKDGSIKTGFTIVSNDHEQVQNIYLYLRGSYTTLDGKQSYGLNDLYKYVVDENRVTIPFTYKERIIEIIDKIDEEGLRVKV